jgi:superfamily I DNA/RNA helicase
VAANSKVKVKLVRSPAKSELLAPEQLSAEQNKIINHRSSPLLVLGSAGSGKTTTLVNAVASRIAQGLDANNILAITYGRQSASRLRDQIASANPQLHTVNEPIARTFHSIAFLILNDKLLSEDDNKYVLLSGAEQDALITELLKIDAQNLAKGSRVRYLAKRVNPSSYHSRLC